MREIKFRAWNGKKMIYKDIIVHDGVVNLGWRNFEEAIDFKGPLMQFTGLHDKNGKEIYEGDIVGNFGQPLVVMWDYDGYALFDRIQGVGVREASLDDDCEVIGNIYENAELLK
jgi:uncharacterized phage protein (TIGR01671 family)